MKSHSFSVELATAIGLEQAILLSHIYFWWEKNKLNDKQLHDGHHWTYNSIRAFQAQFPYFSKGKIERHLKKSEEAGYIITGNYNKLTIDRTKWYRPTEKCISCFGTPPFPEMGHNISRNGTTIPDTNTDTNTDTKPPIVPQDDLAGFEDFWRRYPNKKAKENARKAWRKLKPDVELLTQILCALEQHKLCDEWQKDGGKYVPHPATWLNAKRWEDELDGSECCGGNPEMMMD